MKKIGILMASLAIILTGCGIEAEQQISIGHGDNNHMVEKLFTVDGCTVYRFNDNGFKYFTNCSGSTQWDDRRGKSTHHEGVQGGQK